MTSVPGAPGVPLRVLFVDDDTRLLDGLRRAMHGYRTRWQAVFALGGGEALAILSHTAFDVVITDMRMPGIDGAALLAEVAEHHPQTIRVVLSGQTNAAAARRAMNVAHQFLAKPIATADLAAAIARVAYARGLVSDKQLRRRLGAVTALPAAPGAYAEMLEAWNDPALSVAQAAEYLARGPAMVAKLLQLAGSSFFGRPLRSTGIADLVSCIGLETLRSIVVAGDLATPPGDVSDTQDSNADARQSRAWLVARIAKRIAQRIDPEPGFVDDAFVAGLLHNIGEMFTFESPAEQDALHARAGAYLLGVWGLPREIVDAVAYHYMTADAGEPETLTAVVRAADVLARELDGADGGGSPSTLDAAPLHYLGRLASSVSELEWRDIAASAATLGSAAR